MDPPYKEDLYNMVISLIMQNDLLDKDGMIICESSKDTDFDFIDQTSYRIVREKTFKTNKFTFIRHDN